MWLLFAPQQRCGELKRIGGAKRMYREKARRPASQFVRRGDGVGVLDDGTNALDGTSHDAGGQWLFAMAAVER